MKEKSEIKASGSILFDKATKIMVAPAPDLKMAASLFEEAYKKGNLHAAYALGTWYLHGEYYKKDRKKAVQLLSEASAANISDASFDLAICYERGAGTKKNLKKAATFYLKAALGYASKEKKKYQMYSFAQAAYQVGRCYFYGFGVAKDRKVADLWLACADKEPIRKAP